MKEGQNKEGFHVTMSSPQPAAGLRVGVVGGINEATAGVRRVWGDKERSRAYRP